MAKRLYQLMSGKLARVENGINVIHKAVDADGKPFIFIPTQSEYDANKSRLKAVGWESSGDVQSERMQMLEAAALAVEPFLSKLPLVEQTARRAAFHEAIVEAMRDDNDQDFAETVTEPAETVTEPVPATVPVNIHKADAAQAVQVSIANMTQGQVIALVAVTADEAELDRLLLEESGNRARMKVVAAIEKRRDEIRNAEDDVVRADAG